MRIPDAFNKLCWYFYQDIGDSFSEPEEMIAFAGRHLNEPERIIVNQFLTKLLNGPHDGAELQRVWHSTDAEIDFPDDTHLRGFLTLIRDMT
jgi:hypothetical protein